MPAGQAWDKGARPGMEVLSADGRVLTGLAPGDIPRMAIREAELRAATGERVPVQVTLRPIAGSPLKFSLWAVGAVFALLSAAVILRRPDLGAARLFAAFAWFAALALAVGPSAGGIGDEWALILQILALLGVAATFAPFVTALTAVAPASAQRWTLAVSALVGSLLALGYVASVLLGPDLYLWVRPALFLSISISIIGGGALLAVEVARRRSVIAREQAAIALAGTACGALPFVALTLVPEAVGLQSVPAHITILAIGLMPAAFAYALLQRQLLGIRRLVHRGMVYGIVTLLLLTAVTLVLAVVANLEHPSQTYHHSSWVLAILLTAGVVAFLPLRRGAQLLVDKFLYRDVPDYRTLMKVVHEDILAAGRSSDVAGGLAVRLAGALNVESALVFLGEDATASKLAAMAGARAEEVLNRVYPHLQPYIGALEQKELASLTWEADSFLVVNLAFSKQYLGYILLGPKGSGEVFSEEQKRFVETTIPLVTLAISEAQLAEELRELNQLLVGAEEKERARVAGDLHDGPLQKALLLARTSNESSDARSLANQLVYDLREICSRLRPAVLDDLGLAPALEWLLDGVAKRSGISMRLTLHNTLEEERFPPDVELALFRVTQEAANNAAKHSGCSTLDVAVTKDGGNLVLRVSDDGVGFSAIGRKGGFGLSGMQERIAQLNGYFELQAAPGFGTIITATVPLGQPQTKLKSTARLTG